MITVRMNRFISSGDAMTQGLDFLISLPNLEIAIEFIHGGTLGMRTRKAGNVPNEEPRFAVLFDDCRVCAHKPPGF